VGSTLRRRWKQGRKIRRVGARDDGHTRGGAEAENRER